MRQHSRNVRRAWDNVDYRPPKRIRLENESSDAPSLQPHNKENTIMPEDIEDNLERAIRETSVAALSSSPSRKNSTVFSLESQEDDGTSTITPPSSPPPQLQITPPNVKPRKPTFSILEKQKKEKAKKESLKRKADALSSLPTRVIPNLCLKSSTPHALSHQYLPPRSPPSIQFTRVSLAAASASPLPPAEKATTTRPPPPNPQTLVQSVLDFGQSMQPTTCTQCAMTFMPSVPEDKTLHDMFHNRHSAGIELGKPFLKSAMKWCYEVPNIAGAVVVVDRKISLPGRKIVQRVLEVVNKELGSVDIKEEELWNQRPLPGEDEGKKCDRYKAFLHVVDGRCVGICLAERVNRAYRVLPESDERPEQMPLNSATERKDVEVMDSDTTPRANQVSETKTEDAPKAIPASMPSPPMSSAPSSSVAASQVPVPAVVGVSRIWTSRAFRRKGIAHNLLDCVVNQFIYGMEIEKAEVAFSQPTESGVALARGWFGEDSGWCVYTED